MNKNVNEAKLMQILREKKEAQKHQPEKGAIYKPNEEKKHGTKGFIYQFPHDCVVSPQITPQQNFLYSYISESSQAPQQTRDRKYLRLLVLQNILHYVLPENPLISTSPANVVVWS
jgi:hypothetical protein